MVLATEELWKRGRKIRRRVEKRKRGRGKKGPTRGGTWGTRSAECGSGIASETLVCCGVLGAAGGATSDLCPAHIGVFQEMVQSECHFINGTERVRFVKRFIYNREQYVHFDSDVGHFVGDTPYGEEVARYWNSDPEWMEHRRGAVDRHCRHNYELSTPFLVERRVPPSVSISLVLSSSQPGSGRLLCSVMDFYPAAIQVRWFQGQQELSVVATDVVPNGDWTYQLLVLLETTPQQGLTYSCQVEHVSLEQPLRRHWVFLSRWRLQPLPVSSGPAGTLRSVPAPQILGGRPVSPPAPLSLFPCPAAPSVPNKASQFTLIPFMGELCGGILGEPTGVL
ncbi:class II histocompatibility antigen, B-L beta chain-like isoform 2-T2 [Geothlypis trichas]